MRQLLEDSGCAYGSPIAGNLIDLGERVSEKRLACIMRENRIRALGRGPRRPYKFGKPAHLAPNCLKQEFTVAGPNRVWSSDITHTSIRIGWQYLCMVPDLSSRRVVGWSMKTALC